MSAAGKLVKEGVEALVDLAAKKTTKKAAPKAATKAAKPRAPAVVMKRAGPGEDVLQFAAKKPKGTPSFADWRKKNEGELGTLFDYSRLSDVPNVPQHQIPRYTPARGPSERIVEALARPEVAKGINETVERGVEGGGREWYNTEPLYERMRAVAGETDAPSQYAGLMDIVAATSPRSKVMDNIRTASYYNYLRNQGLPVPEAPAKGYGSVAQKLHAQNVQGLEDIGGWDIFRNPKPASFSSNLQGNQEVATIDTHNFRLPGILSQDPRFLETSIAELADDPERAKAALLRHYPGLPEDIAAGAVKTKAPGKYSVTYRPQEWAEKGYITPEEAAGDPALWASKPRENEYGYYETWQQDQARKMGLSPAQYQASMWLGGGEDTGLGSTAEPFLKSVEARVRYTADLLGMTPDEVLENMLRGSMPLLAKGGAVDKEELYGKYAD